jgi:hypothetical protein
LIKSQIEIFWNLNLNFGRICGVIRTHDVAVLLLLISGEAKMGQLSKGTLFDSCEGHVYS